jgi:hypothetical protein
VNDLANAATGLNIWGPIMWMGIIGIAAVLCDAVGRRKGEPSPASRPDIHRQVEAFMRQNEQVFRQVETPTTTKRI